MGQNIKYNRDLKTKNKIGCKINIIFGKGQFDPKSLKINIVIFPSFKIK